MTDLHDLAVPLPANQTGIENAFAKLADRLFGIDIPIREMADPAACPAEFLSYLAWAYSVDVWDPAWSEDRKRAVILASPDVHRLKGTRGAVERAIEALGARAMIVEWFETQANGTPGTFRVDLLHDADRYQDADLRRQLEIAIRGAKPKSRSVSIGHYCGVRGPLYAGSFARICVRTRALAVPDMPSIETVQPVIAAGARITVKTRVLS